MGPLLVKSLVFFWALTKIAVSANNKEESCPHKCTCRRTNPRDDSYYLKLKCGGGSSKIHSLDEVDLLNIASDIVHL